MTSFLIGTPYADRATARRAIGHFVSLFSASRNSLYIDVLNVVSGHVGMIRRKVRVAVYALEENIIQLVALNRSALKILIYLIYGCTTMF